MFLSIIIPTYNRSESLAACLHSVAYEIRRFTDCEVFVVDDNSNSVHQMQNVALCTTYNAQYFLNDSRRGAAASRNIGIARSTGHWIAFLDDDIRVCKDWFMVLDKLLKTLTTNNVGIEGCVIPEGTGLWDKEVSNENGGLYLTCHCIYRASILKKLTGFDEYFKGKYPSCEDHELASRILRYGSVVFDKRLFVTHSSRRINLLRYLASSVERMKSQLDAEFYFFQKQKDRYHCFRFHKTFFGTLLSISCKNVITTFHRRNLLQCVNNIPETMTLLFSSFIEQLTALCLIPFFIGKLLKHKPDFFSQYINWEQTSTFYKCKSRFITNAFHLQINVLNSATFIMRHLPVYSAKKALQRLNRFGIQTKRSDIFLRIDDVFLHDVKSIQTMCNIALQNNVSFLAAITGNDLQNVKYKSLIDLIISGGNYLGLHGFTHTGTFGHYNSELLQMTFHDLDQNILSVLNSLSDKSKLLAFVPPFNAISRDQIYHIGKTFKFVCGGPETVRFTDNIYGPVCLTNNSWYVPSIQPFYNTAKALLESNDLDKVLKCKQSICITLHMPQEANNNFKYFEMLLHKIAGACAPWTRFTL